MLQIILSVILLLAALALLGAAVGAKTNDAPPAPFQSSPQAAPAYW